MLYEECWLPEMFPCKNFAEWVEYENVIYGIFYDDFIYSKPTFFGKPVNIRKYELVLGRERAFYHVTCRNFEGYNVLEEDRNPEPRRCERIRWIRAFIENSNCRHPDCLECEGMRLWTSFHSKTKRKRTKIYLREAQFIVILEERNSHFLLITSYYVDQDHTKRKLDKEYEKILLETGSAP